MFVLDFVYVFYMSVVLGCEVDDDVKRVVVYGVG